ncbi:MAG TPA: hypothetical protein VK436_13645 [Methanocella sp.]|nr:hypothetical protein [Methanocella sp.]
MAEETISTAILTVATIIAAVVLLNAIYPSLYSASGSILSMSNTASSRMKTDMKVLTEYPGTDSNGRFVLVAWIKNTGSSTIEIASLKNMDLYLYTGGGVAARISQSSDTPGWSYTIMNGDGDNWKPGETLQMTLNYGSLLPKGTMKFRLALDNGVFTEDTFSL